MKKFLILSLLINLAVTGSVLAAVQIKQFADVENGSYYDTAVDRMVNLGVVKGYEDGLFHPNDMVNRAQAVTMLDRYDTSLKPWIEDLSTLVCLGMSENSYKDSHPGSAYSSDSDADYKALYKKECQAPMM